MRTVIAGLVALLSVTSTLAHQDPHHAHAEMAQLADNAPIKITINPEVRVSVVRAGALPPPVPCGKAMALPVAIANQGFLTAPLRASLVSPAPSNVHLEFSGSPLKGRPEQRILYVTLAEPGLADITVSFRAKGLVGDLAGRDRIHMLISCEPLDEPEG